MKISKKTLSILKNFANINPNIFVPAGSKLATINTHETVFASCVVDEIFPTTFAIYDLNKFLSALSLFEDPEISFGETSMTVIQGNTQLTYVYADPSTILYPKKTEMNVDDYSVSFNLSKDKHNILSVIKSSLVLDLPQFSFVGDGNSLSLILSNKKNPSTDSIVVSLDQPTDKVFEAVLMRDRLELLPGDYSMEISMRGIVHWINTDMSVQYWTTTDKNYSKF